MGAAGARRRNHDGRHARSQQAAVADISVTLNVNNAPLPAVPVHLRGPADVVGIDAHQIVRS